MAVRVNRRPLFRRWIAFYRIQHLSFFALQSVVESGIDIALVLPLSVFVGRKPFVNKMFKLTHC